MAFSFLPKEDEYFTLLESMTDKIKESATILVEMLDADVKDFSTYRSRAKDVEHSCDTLMYSITTKLNASFITPFDREDIYTLSVALDDICDYIDASVRAVLMYDIREFNDAVRQLSQIIVVLSEQVRLAVANLKKPKGIEKYFLEIHRLEKEADEVYFRAIADLFNHAVDPITVIKHKELYQILENATDRCESVANIIESIVLKHN